MSNSDDSSPEDYILDGSSDPNGHLALGHSLEGDCDFEGAIEALSLAIAQILKMSSPTTTVGTVTPKRTPCNKR